MSYQYGIGICREALTYLTDNRHSSRLVKALGELRVMKKGEDLSNESYDELNLLYDEFCSIKGKDDFSSYRDFTTNFTTRLVFLCVQIIERNAQTKLVDA
jgi:hypothetical protein